MHHSVDRKVYAILRFGTQVSAKPFLLFSRKSTITMLSFLSRFLLLARNSQNRSKILKLFRPFRISGLSVIFAPIRRFVHFQSNYRLFIALYSGVWLCFFRPTQKRSRWQTVWLLNKRFLSVQGDWLSTIVWRILSNSLYSWGIWKTISKKV